MQFHFPALSGAPQLGRKKGGEAHFQEVRDDIFTVVTALEQWGGDWPVLLQWGLTSEHLETLAPYPGRYPYCCCVSIHVHSKIATTKRPARSLF